MQGSPSQVNGVGLRTLSRRRSWVRIPPPAPFIKKHTGGSSNGDNPKKRQRLAAVIYQIVFETIYAHQNHTQNQNPPQ